MAAKGAGLRGNKHDPDSRYYLLMRQYKRSNGKPVESCKQLNRHQVDDFLAICESMGWRQPGKSETHHRDKAARDTYSESISVGQIAAIDYLRGDLGMTKEQLKTFVLRMTKKRTNSLMEASRREASAITEALKSMLSRKDNTNYQTLADVESAYSTEAATDGENQKDETSCIRSTTVSHC